MYSQSKSCVESFHKKRTKKEPEPPLEQPCHRLLPSKLYILENGPKWLPVTTFGILESGFAKTEGKDGLLIMPLFYHVFFLPLPLSFFLSFFFPVLSLLIFTIVLQWVLPFCLWLLPLFILS